MIEYPKNLPDNDPRTPQMIAEDHKLADEYADRGSVKHFALRLGFMPHNNEAAEGILQRILQEHYWLEKEVSRCKAFNECKIHD